MCEQCFTNPIMFGEPLPGIILMRARRDGYRAGESQWKKGEWGLVYSNDPSYRWSITPTPSPTFGMDDAAEEAWYENQKALVDAEADETRKAALQAEIDRAICLSLPEEFKNAFDGAPEHGWRLVEAARTRGYDPETHGSFCYWLFDYLGQWLVDAPMEQVNDDANADPDLEARNPTDYSIGRN